MSMSGRLLNWVAPLVSLGLIFRRCSPRLAQARCGLETVRPPVPARVSLVSRQCRRSMASPFLCRRSVALLLAAVVKVVLLQPSIRSSYLTLTWVVSNQAPAPAAHQPVVTVRTVLSWLAQQRPHRTVTFCCLSPSPPFRAPHPLRRT